MRCNARMKERLIAGAGEKGPVGNEGGGPSHASWETC